MLKLSLLTLVLLFFAGCIWLIVYCRRRKDGDNIAPAAALPAALFTLISCASFVCFRVLYPLTPEYRYWIDADWRGRWSECPGRGLWGGLTVPVFLALLAAGIIVARTTVRRLSANGEFPARRYLLSIVLTEISIVLPLALYTALFSNHSFWWKTMLPAAGAWCWLRVIAMMVTAFSAESAWRDAHPDTKRYGRTTAVLGMLFAYILLTIGGYELVRYQLGEYSDCPCELEGLADIGVILIAGSVAAAAAALVLASVVKGVRGAAALLRDGSSKE